LFLWKIDHGHLVRIHREIVLVFVFSGVNKVASVSGRLVMFTKSFLGSPYWSDCLDAPPSLRRAAVSPVRHTVVCALGFFISCPWLAEGHKPSVCFLVVMVVIKMIPSIRFDDKRHSIAATTIIKPSGLSFSPRPRHFRRGCWIR